MGFKENAIEEIKSRCNIVDVVGRHVVLKKAGSNHKGLCPFHNEKTPSFIVSEARQSFTCFGCGATGDVIEFTKRYHNLDFPGAIEKLAGEYGIELESTGFGGESKKAALYDINREAAAFFYRAFTERENPGYTYMKGRGLEPATLRKFGIGYADGEWQSLFSHLTAKGHDPEVLLQLGLVSKSKDRYFDKFRDRVVFPIINTRGKVIGFGGRILGAGEPKYLNSPETPVFQKKNNLYGLNLTRQDISKENCAILVEGYMDAVSLYQHGVRHVAASLGTALTPSQAAMLRRYCDNVVLAYDADQAGQAAALRGMDILYEAGCHVRVLHIDDGKDPDDFIRKHGKEDFLELVKQAKPFADHKFALLARTYDTTTTDGRLRFLKEAAEVLRRLRPMEADLYVRKLARDTRISEGAIRRELEQEGGGSPETAAGHSRSGPAESAVPATDAGLQLQKTLIKLLLVRSDYIPQVGPYTDAFSDPDCFRLYEMLKLLYRADAEIDLQKLEDNLDEPQLRLLADIRGNVRLAGREDRIFAEIVGRIQKDGQARREDEIIGLLSVMDDENDKDAILQLTKELMRLQKQKTGETANDF